MREDPAALPGAVGRLERPPLGSGGPVADQGASPAAWLLRDADAACVICGRLMDGTFPIVHVRNRARSLRVCALFCGVREVADEESEHRAALEIRVREAERLGALFDEFNSAAADGFASFGEVAPILVRLVRTQCVLLGVVGRTPDTERPATS